MSEFLITIQVEPYLADWIHCHFGNPVKLIKESPEQVLLKRFLDKAPLDYNPIGEEGNVRIEIPSFKEKDARCGYHYLSPRAKGLLAESFETLFLLNMWSELGNLDNVNCELTSVIYAWLEKHKMDDRHWETVRQKYYRLRKKYRQEKNIKISA